MAEKWILTSNESVSGMRCGVEVNSRSVEKSVDLDRGVFFEKYGKRKIYVPERTCRDIETRTDYWQCSECGVQLENPYECPTLWDGYRATSPLFCPNCGARVVE